MLEAIIQNLINVGWALLIFLTAYAANIIFSLWYNIKIQSESFSWRRLGDGALKCGVFLLGLALLCVAITSLPLYATQVGWPIPEEFTDIFTDLVIIGAFLLVACRYIKEAFTKLLAILNNPDKEPEDEAEPLEAPPEPEAGEESAE